jgi:hypothetical protein
MKITSIGRVLYRVLLAGLICIPIVVHCQATKITWSSFNMGNAASPSSGTIIRSVVGQSLIGETWQRNSFIESGFLADTLLRGMILEVHNGPAIPLECRLDRNYPNPFNSGTKLQYSISKSQLVRLVVYDMLGREVATLINEVKHPGVYTATWDASTFASGVYVCRMQAGSFVTTRKIVLLR